MAYFPDRTMTTIAMGLTPVAYANCDIGYYALYQKKGDAEAIVDTPCERDLTYSVKSYYFIWYHGTRHALLLLTRCCRVLIASHVGQIYVVHRYNPVPGTDHLNLSTALLYYTCAVGGGV